jgi:hypothetical protein
MYKFLSFLANGALEHLKLLETTFSMQKLVFTCGKGLFQGTLIASLEILTVVIYRQ